MQVLYSLSSMENNTPTLPTPERLREIRLSEPLRTSAEANKQADESRAKRAEEMARRGILPRKPPLRNGSKPKDS